MSNKDLPSPDGRTPAAPPAPANLHIVANYATSCTIAWDAAIGAGSYEVWLESTDTQSVKTPVSGLTYTATGLLPNTTYHFRVYAAAGEGENRLLSPTSAEKNTTTESIIIVDVIECPPGEVATICPLTCGAATIETPNIVRWNASNNRDFHKIRIKAKGTGTVLAQAVLERTWPGGVLHIRNMMNLLCDNTQLAINPPQSTKCPNGVPPLSFCGTFPQNGSTVGYRIEADIDKCVVQLLAPANLSDYIIEAECCLPPQGR